MDKSKSNTKPGNLKQFFPFTELPPEYVIIAANFANTITRNRGETILETDAEDPNDYFLLNGSVLIRDLYDGETVMESGSPEALNSLPQLRPSAYTVVASGPVRLISIPQEVIRRVRAEAPEKLDSVEDDVSLDITQSREFFNDFKEELRMNRVRLPSLPGVAGDVHRCASNN